MSAAAGTHYEVLGVPRGADQPEIRRAYLRLAREHHPDRHVEGDAATQDRNRQRMQRVNEAWSVLGDPERRARYDEALTRGTAEPAGRGRPGAPPKGPGWRPRADDTGWMDDFQAWKHETDDLLPPEDAGHRGRHDPLVLVPIGTFLAGVGVGMVGVVLMERAVMAAAWMLVALSAVLYFLFPLLHLGRTRGERARRHR